MKEEEEREEVKSLGRPGRSRSPSRFGDDEIGLIQEILDSGRLSGFYKNFSGGRYVQEFEEAFRKYHDMDYAISTSSGTSALHTAYLACGIGPGDEVITTPYTFSATASMILACGARPVFADVDPLTYNLDPEKAWDSLTPATKAIVPVHLLGHPCEMDTFSDIRDHKNMVVIEDAAQALGARYSGELVGTLGDVACFSFQETKQVACGEGGMILTNDRGIAERARAIRNHGEKYGDRSRTGTIDMGYNYRLTEIQAAIGLCQFKKLDFYNNCQIGNAKYLASQFKEIPGLRPPCSLPQIKHVYSIFGAQFHPAESTGVTRTRLIEDLTRLGYNRSLPGETIGAGYGELVYQLPCLSSYAAPCPIAEGLLKTALWIDLVRWPNTRERMGELAEAIRRILGEMP